MHWFPTRHHCIVFVQEQYSICFLQPIYMLTFQGSHVYKNGIQLNTPSMYSHTFDNCHAVSSISPLFNPQLPLPYDLYFDVNQCLMGYVHEVNILWQFSGDKAMQAYSSCCMQARVLCFCVVSYGYDHFIIVFGRNSRFHLCGQVRESGLGQWTLLETIQKRICGWLEKYCTVLSQLLSSIWTVVSRRTGACCKYL